MRTLFQPASGRRILGVFEAILGVSETILGGFETILGGFETRPYRIL